jgi:uncharacterized protein YxjI
VELMQFRRQERRDDRHGRTATRFQVHQRAFSIGDDFFIDDEHGNHAYRLNGKALRVRQRMLLEDADGNVLLKIQQRLLRIKDSMNRES